MVNRNLSHHFMLDNFAAHKGPSYQRKTRIVGDRTVLAMRPGLFQLLEGRVQNHIVAVDSLWI
jgi:hypothetical protein